MTTCENCCACCMEQSSPPGYVVLLTNSDAWPDERDAQRLLHAPPEAKRILEDYLVCLKRGEFRGEQPCVWLDREQNCCRFYEFRPTICREFEAGSEECHSWRDIYQLEE